MPIDLGEKEYSSVLWEFRDVELDITDTVVVEVRRPWRSQWSRATPMYQNGRWVGFTTTIKKIADGVYNILVYGHSGPWWKVRVRIYSANERLPV